MQGPPYLQPQFSVSFDFHLMLSEYRGNRGVHFDALPCTFGEKAVLTVIISNQNKRQQIMLILGSK